MTERFVCTSSEDVQAGFGFSVYVVIVLLKRHSYVIGHSRCCRSVGVRYGYVIEIESGLCVVIFVWTGG